MLLRRQPIKINSQPGKPLPLGATVTVDGVNFAVFSENASSVILIILEKEGPASATEITLDPQGNRTGDIWHIHLSGLTPPVRYAFRVDGPFDPEKKGHWFQKEKRLLDPYASAVEGSKDWGSILQNILPPAPRSSGLVILTSLLRVATFITPKVC